MRPICCVDTAFHGTGKSFHANLMSMAGEKRAFNSFLVAILGKQTEEFFRAISKQELLVSEF